MSRLRILHAIHDFLPRHCAGSELYAYDLACEQARGHDVWVLAAEYDPSTPHGQLRWRVHEGLPVIELINNWAFDRFAQTWASPRLNRQLEHVLHAVRPDVLHVHNLLNLSFDLPRLALARGARAVATLHDYTLVCPSGGQRVHAAQQHVCDTIDIERCATCFGESVFAAQLAAGRLLGRGPWLAAAAAMGRRFPALAGAAGQAGARVTPGDMRLRLAWSRSVLDAFDAIVAPSRAIAAEFERLGASADRLEVSGYGSTVIAAQPRQRRAGPVRIGFVGTLTWHKGPHVLLDAARHLRGAWEIVLHGDPAVAPGYAQALERAAAGLRVTFAGPFGREAVPVVYGGLDVLVVPSLWPENAPFVIQEARAHAVAVVGARIGGIPEFVRAGTDGDLFEPGSAADLARALQPWIDDRRRLDDLQPVAPKTIVVDAAEWEARYRRVLNREQSWRGALA